MGRAFFLIQAGEAVVLTKPGGGPEDAVATLTAGDYFGGHTLTTEQRNVATIVAKGPLPLVTWSMSRVAFEESGLAKKMHFPKRPAIYFDVSSCISNRGATQASQSEGHQAPLAEEEVEFICAAIRRNVNLRALHDASDEMLHGIARSAERRKVPRGVAVAEAGELGQEFFIVREGSFDVFQGYADLPGQQSAEAVVSLSTMMERLIRKADFLRSLTQGHLDESPNNRRRRTAMPSGAGTQPSQGPASTSSGNFPARVFAFDKVTPRGGLAAGVCTGPAVCATRSVGSMKRVVRQPRQRRVLRCGSDTEHSDADPSPALAPFPSESAASDRTEVDGVRAGLGVADSFGELSLLYNARREATFVAHEDAVVYVICRRAFTACFNRRGQRRVAEYCKLLEEVHTLSALLSPERWELASNATGLVEFKAGERVLHQGRVRKARQWYVVYSGSGEMSQDRLPTPMGAGGTVKLGQLKRADHFGERSLLRGDAASQVNVDAGPEGMVCLTFDFDVVRVVLESIFSEASGGFVPSVHCDIEEWCAGKARGWHRLSNPVDNPGKMLELKDMRRICTLGRGGFGEVLLVDCPPAKTRYALKVVSKGLIERNGAERQITWERELLLMVNTEFVIRLYKTFRDSQHVYFLMEVALGGNLLDLLHTQSHLFIEDDPRGSNAAFYLACIVAALEHLHERRIAFRDLKPENALLDDRGYAKLCDLGFARFVLGKTNTLAGTPDYMAPEMIDFPHTHDQSVDWWSLGVLGFEMLAGQPPFEDEGISEPMGRLLAIRRSQERGRLEFPFHFPRVAKGFVKALLQKLPKRLGAAGDAQEVRGHEFWAALAFDFAALHARTLPAPVPQQEVDPYVSAGTGCLVQDFLLQNREDSLFVPYEETGTSTWDKDF